MPTPSVLFAGFIFGLIGLVVLGYGKKYEQLPTILIGVVYCISPYLIHNLWLLYGLGVALAVGLYLNRH